jgi:preprotein translocase subunit SecB
MASNGTYNKHAIQLVKLRVLELALKVNNLAAPKDSEFGEFSIETAHSAYNHEKRQINVRMRVISGEPNSDEENIINLKVEVLGVFDVNENAFPMDKINHWADFNAPLVLYPYVREHVYSLTSRAGFTGALLPLLEIPTFKVTKPESSEEGDAKPKADS